MPSGDPPFPAKPQSDAQIIAAIVARTPGVVGGFASGGIRPWFAPAVVSNLVEPVHGSTLELIRRTAVPGSMYIFTSVRVRIGILNLVNPDGTLNLYMICYLCTGFMLADPVRQTSGALYHAGVLKNNPR
ncbi:MAG: hypothetical protein ACRERV_00360 [Methylococcales bacterium]